ncbi:Tripartite motif containing 37 [Borealophlyctis nickersoniae]|nr:Tripartite motif containing 37 [Borealophlyctis nickersoniae]
MSISELIHCRFIDDLMVQLRDLPALTEKAETSSDKCARHSAHAIYFCNDCQDAICADCAVIEETVCTQGSKIFIGTGIHNVCQKHKSHRVQRLSAAYESRRQPIEAGLGELRTRLLRYEDLLVNADEQVALLKKAKKEVCGRGYTMPFILAINTAGVLSKHKSARRNTCRSGWLRWMVNLVGVNFVLPPLISRSVVAAAYKNQVLDEMEMIRVTLKTVEGHLAQASQVDMINNSEKVVKLMHQQHPQTPEDFPLPELAVQLESDFVPPFDGSTFLIKKFRNFRQTGEIVYSEPMYASGLTWRLKVYGSGSFLSVFLELLTGDPHESSPYQYRVEMIHHSNGANISREFTSDFKIGDCWGYNRFFRLNLIEPGNYWNEQDDTIELRYFVRAPTFRQRCRDLAHYISCLHQEPGHRPTRLQTGIFGERSKQATTSNIQPQPDTKEIWLRVEDHEGARRENTLTRRYGGLAAGCESLVNGSLSDFSCRIEPRDELDALHAPPSPVSNDEQYWAGNRTVELLDSAFQTMVEATASAGDDFESDTTTVADSSTSYEEEDAHPECHTPEEPEKSDSFDRSTEEEEVSRIIERTARMVKALDMSFESNSDEGNESLDDVVASARFRTLPRAAADDSWRLGEGSEGIRRRYLGNFDPLPKRFELGPDMRSDSADEADVRYPSDRLEISIELNPDSSNLSSPSSRDSSVSPRRQRSDSSSERQHYTPEPTSPHSRRGDGALFLEDTAPPLTLRDLAPSNERTPPSASTLDFDTLLAAANASPRQYTLRSPK